MVGCKQLSLNFEHSFFGALRVNAKSLYGYSNIEPSLASLNTCRVFVLSGLAFNDRPLRAPLADLITTKVIQSYSIWRISARLEIMHIQPQEIAQQLCIYCF